MFMGKSTEKERKKRQDRKAELSKGRKQGKKKRIELEKGMKLKRMNF